MFTGMEIINDNGSIIIDQNYLSMSFLGKGSITLNQEYGYSFGSGTYGPYFSDAWRASPGGYVSQAGAVMVAFRARYATRPVGVFDGGFDSTMFVGYSSDGTPPIVDYWFFGRGNATSVENVGLQVFDEVGQPTFISGLRSMKVVNALSDVVLQGQSLVGPAGGDYAIVVGEPFGGVRSGTETNIGAGAYAWGEVRPLWYPPTSTGFGPPTVDWIVERKESYSYPSGWRGGDIRGSMLLVDVAGL